MRCIVESVQYKIDINTLHRSEGSGVIGLNDIGRISIRTSKPIFVDSFKKNKETGSVILIDEFTNETVAAGIVLT
jgi:sulfate adenylyltransferase subunit 1